MAMSRSDYREARASYASQRIAYARNHGDDCTCSACDREPDECPECGELGDWSRNDNGMCDVHKYEFPEV